MPVTVISIPELISATDCPQSQRSCCYDRDSLAVSCVHPDQAEVAQHLGLVLEEDKLVDGAEAAGQEASGFLNKG